MDRAIEWATAHATILPITISANFPTTLQEQLRTRQTDAFDSLALALQTGALLVTDDLPTREVQRTLTGHAGVWLHAVFGLAHAQNQIDTDAFVRWSAFLVKAGHSYLGVSGAMLAHAARLDGVAAPPPGYLFKALSQEIGGWTADPRSHAGASFDCLRALWTDPAADSYRQPVTGHLLRQLIHERQSDFAVLIRTLLVASKALPALEIYMRGWIIGHFLADIV
ncbi:hypothetical protein MKK65_00290 [Methylobacterium sp. J-001]|uniref:hypothetical protein n=1 Tax=Methylobacterium sp. J-001 TaxID=2836609 RepID=UPI001FB9D76F|nr:hypothetical protein [Methylobacterium sp. J-001]MCJ2115053.1 hypothetical protein [Methylobacterium sp. J-001]